MNRYPNNEQRGDPYVDHQPNLADDAFIFPEETAVLGILENAGVSSEVNDQVMLAIRPALERSAITGQVERFLWELARRGNANTAALTRGISREAGEYAIALAALRKGRA